MPFIAAISNAKCYRHRVDGSARVLQKKSFLRNVKQEGEVNSQGLGRRAAPPGKTAKKDSNHVMDQRRNSKLAGTGSTRHVLHHAERQNPGPPSTVKVIEGRRPQIRARLLAGAGQLPHSADCPRGIWAQGSPTIEVSTRRVPRVGSAVRSQGQKNPAEKEGPSRENSNGRGLNNDQPAQGRHGAYAGTPLQGRLTGPL